jgi:hypothetical protein
MTVDGESNSSSGEFVKSCGSRSLGISLLGGTAGEGTFGDMPSCAGEVDDCAEPDALFVRTTGELEYRQSLFDFVHVAQRGFCSSHFTLLRLQVKHPVVVLKPLAREGLQKSVYASRVFVHWSLTSISVV